MECKKTQNENLMKKNKEKQLQLMELTEKHKVFENKMKWKTVAAHSMVQVNLVVLIPRLI